MIDVTSSRLLKYLVIIVLCLVTFGDQLNGKFLFDDTAAIKNNKPVSSPHRSWTDIFRKDFWGTDIMSPLSHKSYRPLTSITFRIEYQWHGKDESPFWMKLTNLSLHTLISCLLLEFGDLFIRDRCKTSFLAAILFSVHPVHTEAISGIVGRADLLSTLCFILGVWTYFKAFIEKTFPVKLAALLIPFLTIIGVLCKETAITLLFGCVGLDILYNTNLLRFEDQIFITKAWKRIPFTRIIILGVFCTSIIVGRLFMGVPQFQVEDNPIAAIEDKVFGVINQFFLHSINAWLLLCPDWLSFDWSMGCVRVINSWMDHRLMGIFCHLIVLFLLLLTSYISRRQFAALMLIVLPFLPASGLIHVGFVIAERILYMPSLGWCLLAAIGLRKLLRISSKGRRKWISIALKGIFIFTTLVFIHKSRLRAAEWNADYQLYMSGLKVCPNNAKVHYNMANVLANNDDPVTAIRFYQRAIELYPNYDAALMNLGNIYKSQNDLGKAEHFLRRALTSTTVIDRRASAEMNLGIVMAMKKNYNAALEYYKRALEDRPKYPVCHFNMGNAYIELKEFALAQNHFLTAINMDKTMEVAWKNLLTLLYNQQKYEEVIRLADQGIAVLPMAIDLYFPKANALAKLKLNEEAEEVFLYIIEQRPQEVTYLFNLGVLYHHWKRYEKAEIYYEKALQINPYNPTMRDALSKAKRLKMEKVI